MSRADPMRRSLVVFLAVACLTPGSPRAAPPPDRMRALQLHTEGTKHYESGRYGLAVARFEEAFAIFPEPVLLFNIARAHHKAGDLRRALTRYEEFQTLRSERYESEHERAERYIEELRAATASEVPSDPSTPGASLMRSENAPSQGSPTWPGWVTLGAGVALGTTCALLHVAAEARRDEVRTARDDADNGVILTMSLTEAEGHTSAANTLDTWALVAGLAGGAAVVSGLILVLTAGGDNGPDTTPSVRPVAGGAVLGSLVRF